MVLYFGTVEQILERKNIHNYHGTAVRMVWCQKQHTNGKYLYIYVLLNNFLAEKIKVVSDSAVSVKILGTPIKHEDVNIYSPNVNKALSINAHVKILLNESIMRTIKFNKSN